MRKRAHIWATAFWIKMQQNRRRRPSSPFSSACSFYIESHARAFEHRFEHRDLPTEAEERETPWGLYKSSALSSGSGRVANGEQRASFLNHIRKSNLTSQESGSSNWLRASSQSSSVCNLCCFRNQRNSSSEAVCIFWQ